MPNKIYLDVDETVGVDTIAEMQRSMMEAALMYPGCEFEVRNGTMQRSGDFRIGTHVNLYPEADSSGLYGLSGDQESHIVLSRDPMTYGGGLGYRSVSGRTHVVKADLNALDGLTSDERVNAITKAITREAGRMYGRRESLLRDDLSDEEIEDAWNEIQGIFADEAGDPEEELEQLDEVFSRIRKNPSTGKRQQKLYCAVGEKTAPAQKPKQKKAPQQAQSKKKPQPKATQPKLPQKKSGGGKRKVGPMKVGKISGLK